MSKPQLLAFDVLGTLVDPSGMEAHLRPCFGESAGRAAALWRAKQLEFAIRRALMRRYVNFDVCTAHALTATAGELGRDLSSQESRTLLDQYLTLPAFPDVAPGLRALAEKGHRLVAFSNGTPRTLRLLFEQTGILGCFEEIVSVDEVKTYKPDPVVYEHLAARMARQFGVEKDLIWLVSSNLFDVIGAKSSGLRGVWIRRDPKRVIEPWEFAPDLIVESLGHLALAWGEL